MKRILPAYPLFVKDPYFSLWSPSENLSDTDVMFWNGSRKRTFALVCVGDKLYSFLGNYQDAEKLPVKDIRLSAFSTEFDLECSDFSMTVRFISPLPPCDLELLSNPVCYMEYSIDFKGAAQGEVRVALSLSDDHCCDFNSRHTISPGAIVGGVVKSSPDNKTAWFGLRKQTPLSVCGDSCSADWGYFYVEGSEAYYHTSYDFGTLLKGGAHGFMPKDYGDLFITAVDRFAAKQKTYSGVLRVAFDDLQSISYFGDALKGYFFRNGKNFFDALDFARTNFDRAKTLDRTYTDEIVKSAAAYGNSYKTLLFAALRQSVAAHKVVEDKKGRVLFLSKECHSNGCIATVDVSYPSIPAYLLYNPELVKGMLVPVLDFAKMPVWEFDFAPHDAGTYPACCGQAYGMNGSEIIDADVYPHGRPQGTFYPVYQYPAGHKMYKFEDQMPVEECANMLIMSALYHKFSKADDKSEFLADSYEVFKKWVEYLVKYGKVPEHQLCTDDFAGRLAKNVNLSIKASVGIAAFAYIAKAIGRNDDASDADGKARSHAGFIVDTFKSLKNTPLVFDAENETFSIKYNLAADLLLGSHLYPQEFLDREIETYIKLQNAYGMPLDNRRTYTKSDWILWAASLAKDKNDAAKLVAPIEKFLCDTPNRVPFSDWYDTQDSRQSGFQNRTVQGGLFMLLLKDSMKA